MTKPGHAPPSDYFESFLELGRLDVLESKFARRLAQAAGLRNRIAHEYDDIDEQKVYEGLLTTVKVTPDYLRAVNAFIEKSDNA